MLGARMGCFYTVLENYNTKLYMVRDLDSTDGTAARVRVLVEHSDGDESWGTIGVHPNIIEASWQALVDSIEYKLLKEKE